MAPYLHQHQPKVLAVPARHMQQHRFRCDVVRLDVEDYLPCSYAQCRHLLDAAPAHVAPRLPAAELRAKRLARFAA